MGESSVGDRASGPDNGGRYDTDNDNDYVDYV